MAIAMGLEWRASDMMTKKRSWGDDQQKLFDLMIGASNSDTTRHTLDLLGGSSSGHQSEFVELDTEMPLPSGWEKRLDLKSGTVYFVDLSTGRSTPLDPRSPGVQAPDFSASHEFLSSKQSEMLKQELFSTSEDHDSSQLCEAKCKVIPKLEDESLELNLKLCISDQLDMASVCTMEKVQQALARSQKQLSYSFHDASTVSAERLPWALHSTPSPATSSSSSSSALSSKRARIKPTKDHHTLERKTSLKRSENAERTETSSTVTLTVCKNCFMYVMLSASDPRCPRCSSTLVLDFSLSVETNDVQLNL